MKNAHLLLVCFTLFVSSIAAFATTEIEGGISEEGLSGRPIINGELIHWAMLAPPRTDPELKGFPSKFYSPHYVKFTRGENQKPLYLTSIRIKNDGVQGKAKIYFDRERDLVVGESDENGNRFIQILSRGDLPALDTSDLPKGSEPSIVSRRVHYLAFVFSFKIPLRSGGELKESMTHSVFSTDVFDLSGGMRKGMPKFDFSAILDRLNHDFANLYQQTPVADPKIEVHFLNEDFGLMAAYRRTYFSNYLSHLRRAWLPPILENAKPKCEMVLVGNRLPPSFNMPLSR